MSILHLDRTILERPQAEAGLTNVGVGPGWYHLARLAFDAVPDLWCVAFHDVSASQVRLLTFGVALPDPVRADLIRLARDLLPASLLFTLHAAGTETPPPEVPFS